MLLCHGSCGIIKTASTSRPSACCPTLVLCSAVLLSLFPHSSYVTRTQHTVLLTCLLVSLALVTVCLTSHNYKLTLTNYTYKLTLIRSKTGSNVGVPTDELALASYVCHLDFLSKLCDTLFCICVAQHSCFSNSCRSQCLLGSVLLLSCCTQRRCCHMMHPAPRVLGALYSHAYT